MSTSCGRSRTCDSELSVNRCRSCSVPGVRLHLSLIATITLLTLGVVTYARAPQNNERQALVAALEALIATGEPRHMTHDQGEELQLAVDAAIARGDREIEGLAARAASPLTASITRPVSSIKELPGIEFNAQNVLRVPRPVLYIAQVSASVDNGEFAVVKAVEPGKSSGAGVNDLSAQATRPGLHVVRLKAELKFGMNGQPGAAGWTETRTLAPVYYAIYDSNAESSEPVRRLIYGPASTPVREFDPMLGDEPFAVWLNGVLSARRAAATSTPGPEWLSQYCDERIGEAGSKSAPTAVCSVVYFGLGRDIGQIWFRTADIRATEQGVEWVPVTPALFEGLVIKESAPQSQLSKLPLLLDAAPETRPVGDVAIMPDDIVVTPLEPQPGAFADATITVRNIGEGDLHEVNVHVAFGVDPASRGTSRQFVVDIPAQQSTDLKLQVAFPNGYGFVMAFAMQLSEHSPFDNWTPDPTPLNTCAFRIVNSRLTPPKYVESLLHDAGGCNGK